jgi:hypothetical protein
MNRRALMNGGLLTGIASLVEPQQSSRGGTQGDDAIVARAISDLNDTLRRTLDTSRELVRIREQQRIYLRAAQKFPDFIEVGIAVWESVYDWHVRHQLPLSLSRNADGRYAMTVAFTTLVLRPDAPENYVGAGMDAR